MNNFRIRQHDAVLGSFSTRKAAAEEIAKITIDGEPARDKGAVIDRWNGMEWVVSTRNPSRVAS